MSGVPELLLTYGPLGILVICLIIPWPGADCPILVPFWYVKKLNQEAQLKDLALMKQEEVARQTLTQLEMSNQLVGELRQIAQSRSGGRPDDPAISAKGG